MCLYNKAIWWEEEGNDDDGGNSDGGESNAKKRNEMKRNGYEAKELNCF